MKLIRRNLKEISRYSGISLEELEYYDNNGMLEKILKEKNIVIDDNNFGSFFHLNLQDKKKPIVAIMGHVDHGKTSLVDYLLNLNTASTEAGGITQEVYVKNMKDFILIDTPGHSLFNYIRQNIMKCVDILIIVISIEDGVAEQTKEIIERVKLMKNQHVIIAVSKVDRIEKTKREKFINKIKSSLSLCNFFLDDVVFCEISSKTGEGIQDLIEQIKFYRDILDLKFDKNRAAIGYILDSEVKHGFGLVCTVLLIHGSLKSGDIIVNGNNIFKIKNIKVEDKIVKNAYVNDIIEVTGLTSDLILGEKFYSVPNKKIADNYVDLYNIEEEKKITTGPTLIVKYEKNGQKQLIENLLLAKNYKIVSISIGPITQNDLQMQKETNAVFVIWGVSKEKDKNIPIIANEVIYKLTEQIDEFFTKPKEEIWEPYAEAEVIAIFTINKVKKIAGCRILDKSFLNGNNCIIKRNGEEIAKAKIRAIQKNKLPIEEARKGTECALDLNVSNFEIGDKIFTLKRKED